MQLELNQETFLGFMPCQLLIMYIPQANDLKAVTNNSQRVFAADWVEAQLQAKFGIFPTGNLGCQNSVDIVRKRVILLSRHNIDPDTVIHFLLQSIQEPLDLQYLSM